MEYLLPLEVLVLQRDVDLLELPLLIQRHMAQYLNDVANFKLDSFDTKFTMLVIFNDHHNIIFCELTIIIFFGFRHRPQKMWCSTDCFSLVGHQNFVHSHFIGLEKRVMKN